jgi:hypothetical protein
MKHDESLLFVNVLAVPVENRHAIAANDGGKVLTAGCHLRAYVNFDLLIEVSFWLRIFPLD